MHASMNHSGGWQQFCDSRKLSFHAWASLWRLARQWIVRSNSKKTRHPSRNSHRKSNNDGHVVTAMQPSVIWVCLDWKTKVSKVRYLHSFLSLFLMSTQLESESIPLEFRLTARGRNDDTASHKTDAEEAFYRSLRLELITNLAARMLVFILQVERWASYFTGTCSGSSIWKVGQGGNILSAS